ncbi:hypothetical protein [Agromyces sp. NPDC049794]|uniref:hypothetical protein n=1 Tax=unclassified Agromyces TaxID=2639701 RepID=UPI0033F48FCC
MIPVLVATLMWILLVSLLVLRRRREERTITYATLTIAVSMTLNIDPVYEVLDAVVGGQNLVTLIADLALMIGVFFLGRGVMKASDRQPRVVQFALGRTALAVALVFSIVAFVFIDQRGTTTTFMLDLGDQPAAAAYSMIHFTYYGVVLAAMAALAAQRIRVSQGTQRLPPTSLLLGSLFGLTLSAVVISMDIAHGVGNLELMAAVSVAYGPLYLCTFVFLCLGFASQPVLRSLQTRSRAQRTRALILELQPAWGRAISVRPGISQSADAAFQTSEPETVLHREIVEIRDALIDSRVAFDLSEEERELVDRAERHLVGAGFADVPSEPADDSAAAELRKRAQ